MEQNFKEPIDETCVNLNTLVTYSRGQFSPQIIFFLAPI